MIIKMKKVLLFTTNSTTEVDADLTHLGQLGIVHISPFQPAQDESIDRVDARIRQMEKAISVLDNVAGMNNINAASRELPDYENTDRGEIALMEEVLDTEYKRVKLRNHLIEQQNALNWFNKWGKISLKEIEDIKKAGYFVKLYLLDNRELKTLSERNDIYLTGKADELNQVVLITQNEEDTLSFEEIKIPQFEYSELETGIATTRQKRDEKLSQIKQLNRFRSLLESALDERIRRYEVRTIQYEGQAIDDHVRYWKGFIPVKDVDAFINEAEKHSWGYRVEDPSEDDIEEIPTLIKSPGWVERIRPVMNFMGLVPGYEEIDVSRVFMLFFTFFTGILVGDAGYGLVFFLLTFLVHRSRKFVKKVEFQLMYTLSGSIIIWGILTGTYFGSETIANLPLLRHLKVDALASFGGDNIFLQKLMFMIGAIHMSIGHLQLAWRYNNSVKAFSHLGWISVIWGLYLLVNHMVLAIPTPGITLWLFVGGALLIALFSNPGPNFLKGVLSSLGNLPLSIINGFSDVISYIRLYAVGLSTVLMATSFNEMAIGDGFTTIASVVGGVLILILGHGLNIILALMAVIVHGVRLNMLEYSGHAGVEYTGTEYEPFKLKNNKSKKD